MVPDLRSVLELDLSRRYRHVVYYFVGVVVVILSYAVLYNHGMVTLEGENHSIFRSFQTVVETMTTTGYGADSPWDTPLMNLFVVLMQVTGIAIGFFTLRLIIIPLFEDAEADLDSRLSPKRDHVVICEYRRDSTVLLDELGELGIDFVLISSDREEAKQLSDAGYASIDGSSQDAESFRRASVDDARAVITDAGGANVNTILTVRTLRPDVDLIALTDDGDMRDVLVASGADAVLSPHEVLGHHLAEKAVSTITAEVGDAVEIGTDIEVSEVPVSQGSRLAGKRIRDSGIREQTGVNVVGAWIDGELQLPPDPDAMIRENTVLLVSGRHEALEELSEFTRPPRRIRRHSRIVLAGFGEVGKAARSVAERAGVEVTTIDVENQDGVDVVGDAASEETLRAAGVEDADGIVVGLPDDSAGLLTTVLAEKLNPEIEILVRVSDTDATSKALRAGADYVLSVPRVSARMIAKELRGEDVLAPASQIRLVRVSAEPFAGSTVVDSGIYERTGCLVIAIDDGSGVTSNVDPGYRLEPDDRMTIVGSDENVQQFLKRYDVTPRGTAS